MREVRLCHSSWEADEQSRATGRGAGGAKGGGRGECEPAKHAPDSEPGKRVPCAGAHTAKPERKTLCRHTPKVGAVCPNWARTDLGGGRSVMSVPTAISEMPSQELAQIPGIAVEFQPQRPLAFSLLRRGKAARGWVLPGTRTGS